MEELTYRDGSYMTLPHRVSFMSRVAPSIVFYLKDLHVVFSASARAKRSRYDRAAWAGSSLAVLRALESVGVIIEIAGIDHFRTIDGPAVFISNHMSTLETFVLPCLIAPFRDVTFVVKKSLIDYPVFRHVMRSRDPVTVGRTNPREDLRTVLEGGAERLKAGMSLIIFPQTTRSAEFDPAGFNTIGVKLAKKENVPIIPVALKTDAWGNGRVLKDFGKIDPSKKVHFAFGEPLRVRDRGAEEHQRVIEFIIDRLRKWNREGISHQN